MTITHAETDAWLTAVLQSAEDLALNVLNAADVTFDAPVRGLPAATAGAYVALVGDEANIQFGVVATPGVSDALARAVLMIDDEEELSADDTIDAISELANILGGGVKRLMAERDPTLRLGLPLFMAGTIQASQGADVWSIAMTFGGMTVHLLVIRHDKGQRQV